MENWNAFIEFFQIGLFIDLVRIIYVMRVCDTYYDINTVFDVNCFFSFLFTANRLKMYLSIDDDHVNKMLLIFAFLNLN